MKQLGLVLTLMLGMGSLSLNAGTMSSKGGGRTTATTKVASTQKAPKGFTVTLTTYWAVGSGSDYWTRRFRSSTGQPLIDGVTVAADPLVLPYGSIIEIEGVGRRVVKDTGTHVINRVASHKRGVDYPVIDIFFANRREAIMFAQNHAPFAVVTLVGNDDA